MSDKPNVAKQYRVALLKAGLTHNGRERSKGDVIHVTADQLSFLRKREFITAEAAAQAKPAKPTAKE